MILGIHCSVRGGLLGALEEAEGLGVEAMQMLPYRRHTRPEPTELAAFRERLRCSSVKRLLVHSRFVPNLASSDAARRARSVELLRWELGLAGGLGAEGFVLHASPYSPGAEPDEGIRLFAESLKAALDGPASPRVLLENVPGGGRRLGATLEELAALLEGARRVAPKAALLLDTAHAWAAGYDLSTQESALRFLARAHRLFGSESIAAFHLNDCRAKLGSMRENHASWGEGFLGLEGVKAVLARPEFESALGILETPKSPEADRRNLALLRGLA